MKSSAWSPLRRPLFRDCWLASIVSKIGSWMQDTAGAWLMTSLTSSPLLIALMQTAATLPVLFLGLLAAAVRLVAAAPISLRYRLMGGARSDLTPALHWGEPHVVIEVNPEDGLVLVTIEYRVDPAQAEEFVAAIHDLSLIRR